MFVKNIHSFLDTQQIQELYESENNALSKDDTYTQVSRHVDHRIDSLDGNGWEDKWISYYGYYMYINFSW